jgi:hypothetical protein
VDFRRGLPKWTGWRIGGVRHSEAVPRLDEPFVLRARLRVLREEELTPLKATKGSAGVPSADDGVAGSTLEHFAGIGV